MISKNTKELILNCRKLADYTKCMEMATKYKRDFDFTLFYRQLNEFIKENGSDEDFEELYKRGIGRSIKWNW